MRSGAWRFLLGARVLLNCGGVADLIGLLAVLGLAVATKTVNLALAPAVPAGARRVAVAQPPPAPRARGSGGGAYPASLLPRGDGRHVVARSAAAQTAPPFPSWARQRRWTTSGRTRSQATSGSSTCRSSRSQTGYPALADWPPRAYEFWVEQSWGAFGWLEVQWPMPVYWPLALAGLAVALAALSAVWRRRARVNRALLAFFAVAAVVLLVGLHLSEYAVLRDTNGLINQGRYLFPLIPLAGLAAAAALTVVPERARPEDWRWGRRVGEPEPALDRPHGQPFLCVEHRSRSRSSSRPAWSCWSPWACSSSVRWHSPSA